MSLNGSGVRDISRALHVSTRTVLSELKKAAQLEAVNAPLLQQVDPTQISVEAVPVRLTDAAQV